MAGAGWRGWREKLGRSQRLRALSLALIVGLAVAPLHQLAGMRMVEGRLFDALSTIAPPTPERPGAIIVAIDEPSFAEIGERWPWSRALHARLLTSLRRAGASVIGLDVLFSEPSDPAADAALAAAAGPETVLAADLETIALDQGMQVSRIDPLPAFRAGGAVSGLVSVDPDGDGVLRRMPVVEDGFGAVALRRAGFAARPVPDGALLQYAGGPRSYPTISYYQALEPERFLPPGLLEGKVVLVGLSLKTAPKVESGAPDAFATPFTASTGQLTAGVEIHATVLDNLRHGLWIVPIGGGWVMAAALALGLAAALPFGRQRTSWRTGVVAALGFAVILGGSFLLLRFGRVWFAPVTPALAWLGVFGARFGVDYALERRLRAAVSEAFSRYVSPALVEELARNPAALKLGGERRVLSVLFCDVRGFTGLSERLKDDPERLTLVINRLLDALSAQVLDARGTIDKYMGDCVMAFWNAPLPEPDHALHAVRAALAMSTTVVRLNAELEAEGAGLPPLAVGVGVNTGACVVGNIGSRWRYDYSVLGDTVNLASRLEGQTKDYGVALILGPGTADAVRGEFVLIELDRIAVRGRSEATAVYTVLAPAARREEAAVQTLLGLHERFLLHRAQGDRPEAARLAGEASAAWPALASYYRKMTERMAAE